MILCCTQQDWDRLIWKVALLGIQWFSLEFLIVGILGLSPPLWRPSPLTWSTYGLVTSFGMNPSPFTPHPPPLAVTVPLATIARGGASLPARATWRSVCGGGRRSHASVRLGSPERRCPAGAAQSRGSGRSSPSPAAGAPRWCPVGPSLMERRTRTAHWRRGLGRTSLHGTSSCTPSFCHDTGWPSRKGLSQRKEKQNG